ncbi:MAG: Bro-N domain-containing protein [Oscillospiraceae bacterium]|nr:Bro-N domain-containing protein [Oscillospiraceae bacterium]
MLEEHLYQNDKCKKKYRFSKDIWLNDKTSSSFGRRGTTIVNESGFYSLVLASRMPNAKKSSADINPCKCESLMKLFQNRL